MAVSRADLCEWFEFDGSNLSIKIMTFGHQKSANCHQKAILPRFFLFPLFSSPIWSLITLLLAMRHCALFIC